MNYIELECIINPFDAEISEILTAELAKLGYESFKEQEDALLAYIIEDNFSLEELTSIYVLSNPNKYKIKLSHRIIEQQNWNETWEKNYFEPIIIENQCVVRSTFHPEFPEIKYQITIDPKMAFGTGHHETTSLMIKEILQLDLAGKIVLDMGCGTGILAILSAMLEAKNIQAVDIDEWSYNNTLENTELNGINNILVFHGDIDVVKNRKYDVIYANINKNVLLNDIPYYENMLKKKGQLLLSGFYQSDFLDVSDLCEKWGLELKKKEEKNDWLMLKYIKN